MKITKVVAALVFGMFLALGSAIGVSAQDDTMKTTTTKTTTKTMKPRHRMAAKHHRMMAKHHRTMKHRMMKKTTTVTKSS